MRRINSFCFFTVVFLSVWNGFSQTTSYFSAQQDTYIASNETVATHGSDTVMRVGTFLSRSIYYYRRGFVEFDLDSIPENAIIYSATLIAKRSTTISGSNPFRVKRILGSWNESTVSFWSQPSISALTEDISSSYTQSNDTLFFDVTAMTQRMVYGSADNYGWSIQVNNEALTSASGCSFYSSESAYVPALKIVWYLPLSISACTITHESGSDASDGSISPTITGGTGGYSYIWTEGSSGDTIGAGSSISGLSYGWYGLEVTGSLGEKLYYAFLVGQECANVEIEYQPNAFFTKNSRLNYLDNGSDVLTSNYFESADFVTTNVPFFGYWWDTKSVLKFNIWIPSDVVINQGDLLLSGDTHTNTSSNISKLSKLDESWDEFLVDWYTLPSTVGSSITVPATTTSNQNSSIEIIDFLEDWQSDNSENHGILFELQYFDDDDSEVQWYSSPAHSTASQRPKITFKLGLIHEEEPYICSPLYALAERTLTGIKYKSQSDILYFCFDSEYGTGSTSLNYKVYSWDDRIDADMDNSVVALTKKFGRNQYQLNVGSLTTDEVYVLEITNEKNEKRYLRFIKD